MHTKGLSRKRKMIICSSLGSGVAAVSYLTFTATNSPAFASSVPALLFNAVCPTICVGMGGMMWFMDRFSKKKNKNNQELNNYDTSKIQEKEFEYSRSGNMLKNNEAQMQTINQ